jgi:hypothetical protein
VVGSCHVDLTPSSRSRTHQNQALNRQQSSPYLSPIATRRGRGARERRMFGQIETGGSRRRHFDAGPPGLKSAGGTPWFNARKAWTKNLQRRFHTGGTPVPRRRLKRWPYGPGTRCEQTPLHQCTSCLPASPAPEGRHNPCRGREAPGLEVAPPPIRSGGLRHRPFDAGPPGLKSAGGTPWFHSRRAWPKTLQRRSARAGRRCHEEEKCQPYGP